MTQTLTIILATAALGLAASRWMRLPAIPLLVVGGIMLTVINALPDRENVDNLLMLGLTFLVFSAGLELNPARVGIANRRAVLIVGFAQFGALGALGLGIAWLFGFSWGEACYIAIGVAASSTVVVVRLLQQRRQFFEPFGRLVLGVLLLQDVLAILIIAALSQLDHGVVGISIGLLFTVGMMSLAGLFVRWISPWLLIRQKLDQEAMLLVALAILFGFVGISYGVGLPLPVGAFLAGVALSGFPVNGLIRGQVQSLSIFFMTMFFVLLGATLDWPTFNQFALAVMLVIVVVVITPLIVLLVAPRAGLSTRAAMEGGLLLAQCSEFSIVIALLGIGLGHIEHEVLLTVALMTVISMALTPFISTDNVTWRLLRFYPTARMEAPEQTGHLLMVGCGRNSLMLLDLLLLAGREVMVIEEDPAVVERLKARGVPAMRGNGADPLVLRRAHARRAHAIISTIPRVEDNARLLRFAKGVTVYIRVFETADAQTLRALGGTPILESHAAADELLQRLAESTAEPQADAAPST